MSHANIALQGGIERFLSRPPPDTSHIVKSYVLRGANWIDNLLCLSRTHLLHCGYQDTVAAVQSVAPTCPFPRKHNSCFCGLRTNGTSCLGNGTYVILPHGLLERVHNDTLETCVFVRDIHGQTLPTELFTIQCWKLTVKTHCQNGTNAITFSLQWDICDTKRTILTILCLTWWH